MGSMSALLLKGCMWMDRMMVYLSALVQLLEKMLVHVMVF
jgi:hypothetical protein